MELKILEAYTRDVGRGVARIDYNTMDKLSCATGDTILIEGKSNGVARCMPLYPSDEDKEIIRMDNLLRTTTRTEVADTVKISKIKAQRAEHVIVSPMEAIPPIDERYLADALENMPIMEEQRVFIPYFGGRLRFVICDIKPGQPAVVTQNTEFEIIEKTNPEMIKLQALIKEKKKDLLEAFSTKIPELSVENIVSEFKEIQRKTRELDTFKRDMLEVFDFTRDHQSLSDTVKKALDQWIDQHRK